MNTIAIKTDQEVKLGVVGAPDAVKARLLSDYYTEEGETCLRTYSADAPNIDKVASAWQQHGVNYIDQVYGSKSAPWEDALIAFLKRIDGLDIELLLMGSCALAVRGIDLRPRGVDLMMQIEALPKIRSLFEDCTIVPFAECPGWVCLGYGAAFLGAQISVGFGPQTEPNSAAPIDSGAYAMAYAETVRWRGYELRVPPIELSLNINRVRGRNERVAQIEKFMAGV